MMVMNEMNTLNNLPAKLPSHYEQLRADELNKECPRVLLPDHLLPPPPLLLTREHGLPVAFDDGVDEKTFYDATALYEETNDATRRAIRNWINGEEEYKQYLDHYDVMWSSPGVRCRDSATSLPESDKR